MDQVATDADLLTEVSKMKRWITILFVRFGIRITSWWLRHATEDEKDYFKMLKYNQYLRSYITELETEKG